MCTSVTVLNYWHDDCDDNDVGKQLLLNLFGCV